MTTEQKIAELMALEYFEWIIEDPADTDRIVADTHAAYVLAIEALRAEIAGERPPADVTFRLDLDGQPSAYTDLRPPVRRLAADLADWVDAHAELLDDPEALVAASAAAFPGVPVADMLEAARLAKAECDMRVLDSGSADAPLIGPRARPWNT